MMSPMLTRFHHPIAWMPLIRRYAAWLVRALVAWLLIGTLVPAPPRAPLMPPQTVETESPKLCMHTRLIEEVDEWKIQRTLIMVRELGAGTIVEFFPWAYIEGSPDQYDWSAADRIVKHARNQGVHIIARMGLVPGWARHAPDEPINEDTTTFNTLHETAYDDFAAFVRDFAARYAGVIDHLIIWNEPNLAFEWGFQTVDPASYVKLLEAVYPAAHEGNPNVTVLAAGLAPTLEPEGSPHGLNDLLFLEQMYQAGAADYFDALAVHTYGFTQPTNAAPAFDMLNFRRAELLHAIMLRYDDPNTPIYITETGWNDHPRWTMAVSPAQRITYTLDALRMAETTWSGWLENICFWVFRYPAPTLSYPDNFTFVDTLFQPRPIYDELQAYARGWNP